MLNKISNLTPKQYLQLQQYGIAHKDIAYQIECFQSCKSYVALKKECAFSDGVKKLTSVNEEKYQQLFIQCQNNYKITHFIPASGKASRMFQSIFEIQHMLDNQKPLTEYLEQKKELLLKNFNQLPFVLNFKSPKPSFTDIFQALTNSNFLNCSQLPKGMIPFHRYGSMCLTPFEEQLEEALNLKTKFTEVHFTVPYGFQQKIQLLCKPYVLENSHLKVITSFQQKNTETLSQKKGEWLVDKKRKLIFRPAGHGCLLSNLQKINSDMIFVKNIDNIAHQNKSQSTLYYKQVLMGVFIEVQQYIFILLRYCEKHQRVDQFIRLKIQKWIPDLTEMLSVSQVVKLLHRPLRICGVVKSTGAKGGSPFWVKNGLRPLQIVESSQVDFSDSEQVKIFNSSNYFNPVFMVLGIKDYQNQIFDLQKFSDMSTYMISEKYHENQKINILEMPGLWNGSMAGWNTVFINTSSSIFTPVKEVFDLLNLKHQE